MENSNTIVAEHQPQLPSILPVLTDSAPFPAVIPPPSLPENPNTAATEILPPSSLPDTTTFPITAPATDLVPSLNTADFTQNFIYKSGLQEYAQKSRIPPPVYQSVNEGSLNVPKFRSTVLVDEVYYVSPNTFRNRKAAEHDAARIALEFISKKTKADGLLLLHKDMMFCKSILSEYAVKMGLKMPTYTTNQHKGSIPFFQSSLVFDGVAYNGEFRRSKKEAEQLAARAALLSLLGDAGNPKSQQTLAKILASKVKFHSTLQNFKDSHPSQMHLEPAVENTKQHFGISIGEKEVRDSVMVNKVESSAITKIWPMMCPFQPEFRSPKPEAPSCSVRLPIEFVPSNSEGPLGDITPGSKKRSRNKKKANKKLRTDNQLKINHLSMSTSQFPSVAQ